MILTEKRKEWGDGAVGYEKNMCEELGISIKPRRITKKALKERRKHFLMTELGILTFLVKMI